MWSHQPPISQLWKLTLPLGKVVGQNFFAKIRGKDELKGNLSNFIPWLRVSEHRAENCTSLLPPLEN